MMMGMVWEALAVVPLFLGFGDHDVELVWGYPGILKDYDDEDDDDCDCDDAK